jgi:hypothetical protein
MTRQFKSGVGSCGFQVPNLVNHLRYLKALPVALVSAAVLGLQSSAQAQFNLSNLYNWDNVTKCVSSGALGQFISIYSYNSADFYGGFASGSGAPRGASPTLTEQFDTTPGATYQISFTMQNLNSFGGSTFESFGDNNLNFQLPFTYTDGGEYYSDTPVYIDFTAVATSDLTTMSIQCNLDPEGGAASLSNLMVTQVPEVSSPMLFGFGGFALLLVRRGRQFFPKLKMKRVRR